MISARSAASVLFLLWASLLVAHTAAAQRESTGRVAVPRLHIGLDANPRASSRYERGDYVDAIRLMKTTRATHFHYAKEWSEVEPRAGVYDLEDVRFKVRESSPLPLAFNLRILDAGARNMPDAYKSLAWDSPEMVAHVTNVIQQLAPALGRRVWSYAIGNEIDMYFASRPQEVAAYGRLLQQVKPRVQALHPRARFTTTLQAAAAGQFSGLYAPVLRALDHVSITYYPLQADFHVRDPLAPRTDIPALLAAARPWPVYLQEFGYPSSPLLGSSAEAQQAFVRAAFEALRAADRTQLLGATYLFQADFPEWLVNDVVSTYGLGSATFRAFITTLGLRDERDRPKAAWAEFVRQAELSQPARREP